MTDHPEPARHPDVFRHGALRAPQLPFAAVAGQAELKLALLLAAVQPYLGGVLIHIEPGTTPAGTVRSFAQMLPAGAPFVEVPRTIDATGLTGAGASPGLLRSVDGGVLFLDGIDQFPAPIVEVIFDAHRSGLVDRGPGLRPEAARFVLVATAGEPIRPRWSAGFGLSVGTTGLQRAEHRIEATRRQLAFESDPASFLEDWEPRQRELRRRLDAARPAEVPDRLLAPVGALTAELRVVGVGADVALARAASALAGWENRRVATSHDLAAAAPMVLRHQPVDGRPHGPDPMTLTRSIERFVAGDRDRTWDRAALTPPASEENASLPRDAAADRAADWNDPELITPPLTWSAPEAWELAPDNVLTHRRDAAARRATDLIVLSVDASDSPGSEARVLAASGALLRLLAADSRHGTEVALVTFGGAGAQVVLSPTASVEVARSRLVEVGVGGGAPLATGIQTALSVATLHSAGRSDSRALLVLVTDGRATEGLSRDPDSPASPGTESEGPEGTTPSSPSESADDPAADTAHAAGGSTDDDANEPTASRPTDPAAAPNGHGADTDWASGLSPLAEAQMVAERVARRSIDSVIIYTGEGELDRQNVRALATRMGATFLTLPELSAQSLAAALRNLAVATGTTDSEPERAPSSAEPPTGDEASPAIEHDDPTPTPESAGS